MPALLTFTWAIRAARWRRCGPTARRWSWRVIWRVQV